MHRETYSIRSRGTRLYLTRRFYDEHGKPPGAQALQDALGILEAKALFDGEELPVHVRVAEHDDKIYVDLANDRWEAVEIDRDGWRVVSDPPVRFRRPKGMKALPHPTDGGGVDALRPFANIKDERDWLLLAAWLVQAFRPTGPYPVLILQGEQGSAKDDRLANASEAPGPRRLRPRCNDPPLAGWPRANVG